MLAGTKLPDSEPSVLDHFCNMMNLVFAFHSCSAQNTVTLFFALSDFVFAMSLP